MELHVRVSGDYFSKVYARSEVLRFFRVEDGAGALPLGGQVAHPDGRVARSTRNSGASRQCQPDGSGAAGLAPGEGFGGGGGGEALFLQEILGLRK